MSSCGQLSVGLPKKVAIFSSKRRHYVRFSYICQVYVNEQLSSVKIFLNTFGGTLEYAELKDQISEEYPNGKVVLFDRSNRSVYLAETGLISLGSKKEKLPDHLTLFEVKEKGSDKVSLIAKRNGVSLTKTFTILPDSYVVKVTHDLINTANEEVKTGLYYQLYRD